MQAKPRSATLTRRNASWHEAAQHRNGNNHAKRPPAMRCGHMSMRNPFTLRGRPLSRHDQERLGVPIDFREPIMTWVTDRARKGKQEKS